MALKDKLKRHLYKPFYKKTYKKYFNKTSELHIKNVRNTIYELLHTNKSISRFGDGEFRWLLDDDHESFQHSSIQLSIRLKQVITSNRKDLLIGLPGAFCNLSPLNKHATNFWKLFLAEYGKRILPYLSFNKKYYDANISRLYIDWKNKNKSKFYFNYLKQLWTNKNILIIEGNKSRLGVGNDLFNKARNIYRIECPNINAFGSYNKIFNCAMSFLTHFYSNIITLIALGPTATILVYDLSNRGYRSIDIGNLDLEYEWYLMQATHKINIPSRFTIEAKNGTKVVPVYDKKYCNEIIHKINN